MLLIDEVDRADDEFEAFLLEVLTEHAVTIPEIGEVRATTPPLVVLTVQPHARGARCAQAALPLPLARPSRPGPRRSRSCTPGCPGCPSGWPAQVAAAVRTLRQADLLKPPGVAETIDWAQALQLVGARHLDLDSAAATLGAVLKYREDADRVRKQLDTLLAS